MSNTVYRNSGDYNTGYRNSGDYNTGDSNTGDRNSGNWNTGDYNTGNRNTRDCNAGHFNSGSWNSGSWNSGSWNSGDCNAGYFNTTTPDKVRVFNTTMCRKKWNKAKKPVFLYFTIREKETYKDAFQRSYNEASKEDQELVKALPKFDAEIFYEISGIDLREKSKKEYTLELTCEQYEKVRRILEREE